MASKHSQLAENEELVREMTEEIWGADGSPDAIDDYFASDVVSHEPDGPMEGREAYKQYEAALRQGLPDLTGEIDLIVCEGDLVAVRYTASGTHTGDLWGMEPTGNSGTVTGQVIYRIENGLVTETWHEYDRLGMFQQLGIIPDESMG